jgi:hypothetical protein
MAAWAVPAASSRIAATVTIIFLVFMMPSLSFRVMQQLL